MTVPNSVDRAAPVIAVHEIDIEAPLETVWHLHVDAGLTRPVPGRSDLTVPASSADLDPIQCSPE